MYPVSDKYKTESRQIIRNPSTLRITYSVIEPDADNLAAPSDNGHEIYSDLADAVLYTRKSVSPIATLEHNRWTLDSSQTILPDSEPYGYVGFIGNVLSGADCEYGTPPTINIVFSSYFAFSGLTFSFDTVARDYPAELIVLGYNDGNQVFSKTYQPDGANWLCEDRIPSAAGTFVNQLVIKFMKSNAPYRRARMEQLVFGLLYAFNNTELQSAQWKRHISPITTELPTENLTWSVIDADKHFDPENASGVYAYLESRQNVSADLGYELNDGSIEWVPLGEMFSTSSFSTDGALSIASFEADSTLMSLTQTYNEGVYASNGATLYDLAKGMLDSAWQIAPKYVLSDKLKNYSTKVPLPADTIRNNLQLIANAGMCQLYTDRDGVVHIDEIDDTLQNFALTFEDLMDAPKTSKVPVLYSVTSTYQDIVVESELSELVSVEVSYETPTLTEFSYGTSTNQTLVASSGVTVSGIEYFAEMCRCTVTGTGTVTINGKSIELTENKATQIYNNRGEDCPISNPLIDSRAWALEFCDWVAAYEQRRNQYSVSDRGFPELDMGDVISVDTSFSDALTVTVVSHSINFSGAISGESEYLIGGGE